MEPIDKIIIRTIILVLGSIFGITAIKSTDSLGELAAAVKKTQTQNAGIVPLPERQK